MPFFTVSFDFSKNSESDVLTFSDIDAPSKERAIEVATEVLKCDWPNEASCRCIVKCEQEQ